jgi:hypothetical protein
MAESEPHYMRLPPPTPTAPSRGLESSGWNKLALAAVLAMAFSGIIGAIALGPAALVSIHRRGGKGRGWVLGLMTFFGIVFVLWVILVVGLRTPR